MRDTNKSHAYNAEQLWRKLVDRATEENVSTLEIAGSTIPVPIERKFGDLEAVQRYVDLVLERVAKEYGVGNKVTVRARKGDKYAHYSLGEIAIPLHESWDRSWAMREIVVLHEIAHHLTPHHNHDTTFMAAMCDIVTRFIGQEAGFMLRVLAHQSGAMDKSQAQ